MRALVAAQRKNLEKLKKILALHCATLFVGVSLTACNSLFYFPSQQTFYTPDTHVSKPFEERTVTTEDGLLIYLWILRPTKTLPAGPRGTVVHFHGNAENMSTHFLFSHWLTDAGFNVVTFDYRGYGQSQGHPSRAGLIKDGVALFKHIVADPELGQTDVYVFAQSLGGAVAIPVLAESHVPNLRAVALESTFDSYRQVARRKLASVWLTWPLQWPLSFLVTDGHSPDSRINDLSVPIVFVHDPIDGVVPYENGHQLFKTYTNGKKEFWDVNQGPVRGHTPAFAGPKSLFREKLVQFFCQNSSRIEIRDACN